MKLRSEEQGLNPLRWPKQTEELGESSEGLAELSRFVPILYKVELNESMKGLDELACVIMTMSSKGAQRVESTRIVDFDFDLVLTLTLTKVDL